MPGRCTTRTRRLVELCGSVSVEQPPAEVEIDEPMVRALLAEQHPDLADLPLQRIDAGWDNDLWRLGDALIVRLLHADLHPANILVEHGTLAAVIDFGDMCAGDRANDLASAWMLLPDGAVGDFFDEYGPVDADTEARSRAWAVLISMMLLDVGLAGRRGRPGGKATWVAPARAAITRVLTS